MQGSNASKSGAVAVEGERFLFEGEASNHIAAINGVPFRNLQTSPELIAYLGTNADRVQLDQLFWDVPCAIIVRSDATQYVRLGVQYYPRKSSQSLTCASIIVDTILEYDLVLAYADAMCSRSAMILLQGGGGQLSIDLDLSRERGLCDDAENGFAVGVKLKALALGGE